MIIQNWPPGLVWRASRMLAGRATHWPLAKVAICLSFVWDGRPARAPGRLGWPLRASPTRQAATADERLLCGTWRGEEILIAGAPVRARRGPAKADERHTETPTWPPQDGRAPALVCATVRAGTCSPPVTAGGKWPAPPDTRRRPFLKSPKSTVLTLPTTDSRSIDSI